MLAILTTHPIQYQVPLWQLLAADGTVPFEVWYLSEHATRVSRDREFQQDFAWDLNMLEGYPHRFLITSAGSGPTRPFRTWINESLSLLFKEKKVKALWVQGWQVGAYWQAVWAAHRAAVRVWLRGESNALREQRVRRKEKEEGRTALGGQAAEGINPFSFLPSTLFAPKRLAKRLLLAQLFHRVDEFLCIGTANRELYRSYGVPEAKLHMTPYAVDNRRFAQQAEAIRNSRFAIRDSWGIPRNAFCILFCGKFIPKKRPFDLIEATRCVLASHPEMKPHLLFVGSGELGNEMRSKCNVVFDAEQKSTIRDPQSAMPSASFTGFLNQTEISKAYVAADVLVLPSDYDETWGLVVNEAMASGLPCIISDRCGCASDLGKYTRNSVFRCRDVEELSRIIAEFALDNKSEAVPAPPSLGVTVEVVRSLYRRSSAS